MASTKPRQLNPLPALREAVRKSAARGCPVCSTTACEVLHSQRFVLPEGHPLAAGYDAVCCEQCGFVYADTTVSQRDYDAFYARLSKYEDSRTSTGGGGSPEDAKRLQETAACVAETIADRSARLLDIGCANGGLLKALRDLGYTNLAGMDPSPRCVNATRQLCQCEAFAGFLSSLPAGIGRFDGLMLSHVLEHVQDLAVALSNVRRLMKPGGLAYLEVPDAARYAECLVAPFQDFNTEHINHFSLHGLRQLCEHHGLCLQASGAKTLWAGPRMPYPRAGHRRPEACGKTAAGPQQAGLARGAEHPASPLHQLFRGHAVRQRRRHAGQEGQADLDRPACRPESQDEKFAVKNYPFQLLGPYGMAVDSKGRLYVADQKVGAIFIFNTETKETELIGNGIQAHFAMINSVVVDDDDRIFVSDGKQGKVMVFDAKHQAQDQIKGLVDPVGMAIYKENRLLYVVDTQQDQVLAHDADSLKPLRKPTAKAFPRNLMAESHWRWRLPSRRWSMP